MKVSHVAMSIYETRIENNSHAIGLHRFLKLTHLHVCAREIIVRVTKSWFQFNCLPHERERERESQTMRERLRSCEGVRGWQGTFK